MVRDRGAVRAAAAYARARLRLTPARVREELTEWYKVHRWIEESAALVFNPFGLQKAMETGDIAPHWSASGKAWRGACSHRDPERDQRAQAARRSADGGGETGRGRE